MKNASPFSEQKVLACIKLINEMVGKPHEDFKVQMDIADGFLEILKLPIWHFFKAKKLEWQMAKAMNRHWECCEIKYDD